MTGVGGRVAATVITLTVLGCSAERPQPTPPAATPPPLAAPAAAIPGRPDPDGTVPIPPDTGPSQQPAAGSLFGLPPPPAPPAEPAAVLPAAERTDPAFVARAYAGGLYTVDWTRPLPGAQKLTATAPWATVQANDRLAHGQHYQPPLTDPRVAAAQVDTVEGLAVDPTPEANLYLATIDVRSSFTVGITTSQALLLLTLTGQPDGGWLVDDTQVVG